MNLDEVLSTFQKDVARQRFRDLVEDGRRWCYHALALDNTVAIVVENHPEYFTLTYKFQVPRAAERFAQEQNEQLDIGEDDENDIVSSSLREAIRLRKRAI